jgi:thiamine pyrophosphate-dependent acetolactate synthase large subunit-like protein
VYVCLDATIQEAALEGPLTIPGPERYRPALPPQPNKKLIVEAKAFLAGAQRPLILFGRGRRTEAAWQNRVALAERLGARMLSDLKAGAMVPTDHPLHVGEPMNQLHKPALEALRSADVIVSLDWIDLGGALRQAFGRGAVPAKIVHAGEDLYLHNGWGKEHLELPPIDVHLLGDADAAVSELLASLPPRKNSSTPKTQTGTYTESGSLNLHAVARSLKEAVGEQPVTFASLARAWPVDLWPHRHPLDYLGKDGGGGVGSGPGITIGAALALKETGRLTVGVLGDGDTLMSMNALWTAGRYNIPALFVIANNRSYYNDELHQEGVARHRGRSAANRWIGQRIDHPAPDIAKLAEAQGVMGIGPVKEISQLDEAFQRALDCVRGGKPCVLDVHIDPGHGRQLRESMAERSFAKRAER